MTSSTIRCSDPTESVVAAIRRSRALGDAIPDANVGRSER